MGNEEIDKEITELFEMLKTLQIIKDKSRTKWLKREIRAQLILILRQF